jgi:lysophospholipase L1-like esterase
VNYAELPEGASTSSLENIRNLTRFLRAKNPAVDLDPETTAFLDGAAPPARWNMTQFAEYDGHYR